MLLSRAFTSNYMSTDFSACETELPPRQTLTGFRAKYSHTHFVPTQENHGRVLVAYAPHPADKQSCIYRTPLPCWPSAVLDNHKLTALLKLPGTFIPTMGPYDSLSLEAERVLKLYLKPREGHITRKFMTKVSPSKFTM